MEVDGDTHVCILFRMTLQNSMESGNYGFPIAVVFCGIGFAYDR